jgi:hypothetical protein
VSAEFTHCTDHESLIVPPKGLEDKNGVDVVPEELRKQQRKQFIDHQVAFCRLTETQGQKKIFWNLF